MTAPAMPSAPDGPTFERFSRHWTAAMPPLAAYVHSLIRDRQLADDVLQDVAVVALRRFSDFDPQRIFQAWVFGIARNLVHEAFRRSKARSHLPHELIHLLAEDAERGVDHLADVREALRECLRQIQGRARDALRLRYTEGGDYDTIAASLRTSTVAARKLVSRLHARLRACILERMGSTS